jgi:two-component system nitrate/nitrite sensor histidine kinase NarX
MSDATLREVLADIQRQLKLRAVTLCLRDRRHQSPTDLGPHGPLPCIGTDSAQQQQPLACPMLGCPDGPESEAPSAMTPAPSERLSPLADHASARESRTPETGAAETPEATEEGPLPVSFPVADQGHRYGTLRVIPGGGRALEPWQIPLLEALANQLAAALNLQGRLREGRRLVLHEERSILARELHDSLAQSLSYLKIQAVRLEAALSGKAPAGSSGPHAIVSEMREGISSAYRQLRELLMTFRLKIGGEGLATALAETVDEFRLRADLEIAVDDRLAAGVLSPNEEVHVLQIVREALSNATRHARAGHVKVRLSSDAESGVVSVEVSDDGVGLGADSHRRGHYGLTIMRERASSLGGTIQIASTGSSGTAVRLRFRPRQGRRSARETQEQPARERTARHPASELRQ